MCTEISRCVHRSQAGKFASSFVDGPQVENILHSPSTSFPGSAAGVFKLCDFGSTAIAQRVQLASVPEIKALEENLAKSTTMQYRSPEMVDVWSGRGPIDEKSGMSGITGKKNSS